MQIFDHRIVVPTASTPWNLIPFGCVHEDDAGHHAELWAECREAILKTPQTWAIGLGDYFTFARRTYRAHITSYKADDNSQRELDQMCRERAAEFYKTSLRPIKDRLLGLAEGNHHWQFMDGTTDTQFLCQLAKVPYLGKASGHNLHVGTGHNASMTVLQMLVHHGDWSSGAMTIGGDLNSVERKAGAWDADIYLFAHTHRKVAWKDPVYGWPKTLRGRGTIQVQERSRVYVRAGCFVRGYVPTCITYAEQKLLRPTDLGWVTVTTELHQGYSAEKHRLMRAEGRTPNTFSRHTGFRPKFSVSF